MTAACQKAETGDQDEARIARAGQDCAQEAHHRHDCRSVLASGCGVKTGVHEKPSLSSIRKELFRSMRAFIFGRLCFVSGFLLLVCLSLQPDSGALRWSSQKGDNDSLRGSKRSKNISLLPINSRIDSRGLEGCVALFSLIGLSFGRTSDVLCLERILMGTLNSIRCAEMEDCDLPCHWPN